MVNTEHASNLTDYQELRAARPIRNFRVLAAARRAAALGGGGYAMRRSRRSIRLRNAARRGLYRSIVARCGERSSVGVYGRYRFCLQRTIFEADRGTASSGKTAGGC